MLTLARKPGETIVLHIPGYEPVTLTVVSVERGKTRIGVDASLNIVILRGELEQRPGAQK